MRALGPIALLAGALAACGAEESPTAVGAPRPPLDLEQIQSVFGPRDPVVVGRVLRLLEKLEGRPSDASLHARLGRNLGLLGQVEPAQWHLREAVRLAPRAGEVHYQLAVFHVQRGELAAAESALRTALEREPGYAAAHRDLGFVLSRLGRVAEARPPLERAVQLDPAEPQARYQLALLLEDDDPERAIELLERTVALDPYHLGAHANLAALYRRSGRTADAERVGARHRELALLSDLGVDEDPEAPLRYLSQAKHYAQHDRWDEAVRVAEAGLGRHPDDPELHYLHGMVRLGRGETGRAQAAYLRALELRPDDLRVLQDLALLLVRQDAPDPTPEARRRLAEALERWPDDEALRGVAALLSGGEAREG